MDWNSGSTDINTTKTYEIQQVDSDGNQSAAPVLVEAVSGEAAVKQLEQVSEETENIKVCLDGEVMNEMGVEYWQKRIRRR